MNTRKQYMVIKAFEDNVPFGILDATMSYSVGEEVQLRPDGRIARKWLEKGYIKEKTTEKGE